MVNNYQELNIYNKTDIHMTNLREQITELQRIFNEAITANVNNNNNVDTNYLKISDIIKHIQNILEPFIQNRVEYENMVFLMGPTGVGKSTLLNYIAGRDLFFKMHNDKPGIFPQDNEKIAYVGQGEGSTTIVPNIWQANTRDFQNTSFIDCAGDFDSSGVITEVINSKIKSLIAQNVKNAKILLVASQDSIGPSGSYGLIFKNGLEKSAQFLNDINYFQDSIGLIVSHAGRIANTGRTIESYLNSVSNNPQIVKYKPVIENLIQHNRIAVFSKYSDEIEENNIYAPPAWNQNQRNKIIDLIQNMTFKAIPQGLFNDSSSVEVREQMSKAFEILKNKAGNLLKIAIMQALQDKLIVRATELKLFAEFIEEKVIHNKLNTGLIDYIKHLNYYNFLKVLMSEDIQKLGQELEFIAPFTKAHHQSGQVKESWGTIVNTNLLFKDVLHEAKIIIHEADELFSAFVEKTKIITIGCFGENSTKLKTLFIDLFNSYKNKANIENNKNDDKYYFYQTEKQFSGFKPESYTEKEPYEAKESYTVSAVPYEDVEHYTRKMWINLQTGKKLGYENEYTPPAKPRHGSIQERLNYFMANMKVLKDVPHTRPIIKHRDETRERDVIKYQTVTKYKDVPQYQDVQVKKFNETKYNQDLKNANVAINDLKDKVSDVLTQIKAINSAKKCNLPLIVTNKIENHTKTQCLADKAKHNELNVDIKPLNDEWKYLEYEAQALSQYEPEIMGNNN